ncbi:hypothetical protein ScPMuIL_011335 [Solemya velum]
MVTVPTRAEWRCFTTEPGGTICDDRFDNNAATVVCRMLHGPNTNAVVRGRAYYGAGTGPIWLDDIVCSGSEQTISNCQARPWGENNCGHQEDVGVDCNPGVDAAIPIRLADGTSRKGRVEVQYNNTWGTVCSHQFDQLEANVICRQLNFPNAIAIPMTNSYFGNGNGPIWLDDLNCNGSEAAIGVCQHKRWGGPVTAVTPTTLV